MNNQQQHLILKSLYQAITQNWPDDIKKLKPRDAYQAKRIIDKVQRIFSHKVSLLCCLSRCVDYKYGPGAFYYRIDTSKFAREFDKLKTFDMLANRETQ